MSAKERFLGMHRSGVKGGISGHANVIHMLILLHVFDIVYLGLCWYFSWLYQSTFNTEGFTAHCTVHTILTILSTISCIPGTFWVYVSMPIHLLKVCHIPFFAGLVLGRLYTYGYRNWGRAFVHIGYTYFIKTYKAGLLYVLFPSVVKPLHSLAVLWYYLVLERIRVAKGTGWENKSAMELEMEESGVLEDDNECPISVEMQ